MRFIDKAKQNQDGLVSLVVVSIIIIVLSILTIGFARIMDRELRAQLNRELSLQAQYAAESGLNDARVYVASAGDPSTSGKCLDPASPPGGGSATAFVNSISGSYTGNAGDNLVKYSCVIIDSTPRQLIYDIPAGDSKVFKTVPAATLSKLFFSWENGAYTPDNTGNIDPQPLPLANPVTHPLPKDSDFSNPTCDNSCTGMLRVTIYPVPASVAVTNAANSTVLASAARTYFLYPTASGGTGIISTANYAASNGTFINGSCNANNRKTASYLPYTQARAYYCNSAVNNLPAAGFYYIRLTALYQSLSVAVQGSFGPTDTSTTLGGAEAVIDVTGEGNDILKREQARIPYGNDYDYPAYTLQSIDTLCKRFGLPKTGKNSFGDAVPDPSSSSDQACAL